MIGCSVNLKTKGGTLKCGRKGRDEAKSQRVAGWGEIPGIDTTTGTGTKIEETAGIGLIDMTAEILTETEVPETDITIIEIGMTDEIDTTTGAMVEIDMTTEEGTGMTTGIISDPVAQVIGVGLLTCFAS